MAALDAPASPALSAPRAPRRPAARGLKLVLAIAVLALAGVASLAIGARPISPETLVQALTAYNPANGDHAVVLSRIPRTLVGLLAGAALGLAGAAMQGVARNPLADPGILGVNSGAALAVVIGIFVFGVTNFTGYIWFAFLGAGAAAVLVYVNVMPPVLRH